MKSVNPCLGIHLFSVFKYCLVSPWHWRQLPTHSKLFQKKITVTRLEAGPIIDPSIHPSIGENIQGPSLIKLPEWIDDPLGKYYLYFADHKGLYIRLAYADDLSGPWKTHAPGSLHIQDSHFAQARPAIAEDRLAELVALRIAIGGSVSHDYAKELTEPHIASPDVHIDAANKKIVMCYHGHENAAFQHLRIGTSDSGIDFSATAKILVALIFENSTMPAWPTPLPCQVSPIVP